MVKRIKWKVTAKGHKRTFRVTTADGKEYETKRTDYLASAYQWGGSYALEKNCICARDLLGCSGGILVADAVAVKPIKVEELRNEEVELTKTLEAYYLIFRPKVPKEFIPEDMKCEEIQ